MLPSPVQTLPTDVLRCVYALLDDHVDRRNAALCCRALAGAADAAQTSARCAERVAVCTTRAVAALNGAVLQLAASDGPARRLAPLSLGDVVIHTDICHDATAATWMWAVCWTVAAASPITDADLVRSMVLIAVGGDCVAADAAHADDHSSLASPAARPCTKQWITRGSSHAHVVRAVDHCGAAWLFRWCFEHDHADGASAWRLAFRNDNDVVARRWLAACIDVLLRAAVGTIPAARRELRLRLFEARIRIAVNQAYDAVAARKR